jgi:hypothetical protein
MRRGIAALVVAVAGVTCALSASAASSPRSLPRVTRASLVYAGAFRLPAPTSDQHTFAYGGTALAYDPAGHGLFVVGHDWYQLDAEVSIPRAVHGKSLSRLHRARMLQPFVDPTGGKIDTTGGDDNKLGGQLVYRGRLVGDAYVYYDAAGQQVASHWARSSTSLKSGSVSGLFRVGTVGPGFVSGFMASVPKPWQRLLGGPALTGNCCIPIISRTSFGPDAFAFDPAKLQGKAGTKVPAKPLLYYSQQHPTLGHWDASWNPPRVEFGGGTAIKGVVFPNGTRSVLYFGTQGVGKFCYGEGTSDKSKNGKPTGDGTIWCYDPDNSSKGTHAYPYRPMVWAYDARDLAAVRAGKRKPWKVRPYAVWKLPLAFRSPYIGGAAYNSARRLVYVTQQFVDGEQPIVAVFHVR